MYLYFFLIKVVLAFFIFVFSLLTDQCQDLYQGYFTHVDLRLTLSPKHTVVMCNPIGRQNNMITAYSLGIRYVQELVIHNHKLFP